MSAKTITAEIMELASRLPRREKRKIIQKLAPETRKLESKRGTKARLAQLELQYHQGYEKYPEDVTDIEAMLPHLAIPAENWE